MLKNYIITAIRNLKKNRFYTLINLVGLTIGITACLVIFLFVQFELSYDKFNANANRIVRVDWELQLGNTNTHKAAVTPPMAHVLVDEYPEVEAATRFTYRGSSQFKRSTENIIESGVVYVDNDLFKIFTIPFLSGNPETALKEPYSMVITEKCARQFFPNEDALGKTLIKDNTTLYTITGIIKELPQNSHFHYQMFLSMEGLDEAKNGNWIGGPYNTYLLLRNGAQAKELEKKLPVMIEKYLIPQASANFGATFLEDFNRKGNSLTLHLRPLLDIHLHSNLHNELDVNGDVMYVYLLSTIALFILIIACINFINLATARSTKRAREVGIRKAIGSSRVNLATQFLAESIILSVSAFLLAIVLTDLLIPTFNTITNMHLNLPIRDMSLIAGLFIAAILIGVAAGIYPGFVLANFQPAQVLKGKLMAGNKPSFLRSGLVIFQFAVSIVLTISTIALYQQMNFIQNKKIGFEKDQIIVLKNTMNLGQKIFTIRDEIVRSGLIKNGTISSYFPGPGSARKTPLMWKFGTTPSPDNSLNVEKWTVDYDYVSTLGMEIVNGRNFSRKFPSDSNSVILNETAIRKFGIQDNPIGQKISTLIEQTDGSVDKSKLDTWTIIGVIKDFNFESIRETVSPLGLFFGSSQNAMAFSFEMGKTEKVIDVLEKQWKNLADGEPFLYSFLDQDFEKMYVSEQRLSKIFVLFSCLAIIIACLGLFALTAYTGELRTKEIGIRKVLGASPQGIVMLLSKDFSKLILFGFVLAVPIAAYVIQWYLQQYAYKTEISPWVYIEAGLLAFFLALFTMGYQSLKAANSNPVNALKTD